MLDVGAYLSRIGFEGTRDPSAAALRELHRAHLYAVPFENLDIHIGRTIVLDEPTIVRKVVGEGRGGFCYELNGAFAALLEAMGFGVGRLAAGVMGEGGFGPPFDHLLLEVTAVDDPRPWLVDVGFGDGFVEPLRLEEGVDQHQDNGTYRIAPGDDPGVFVLWRRSGADARPEPQYRFARNPHRLIEYAEMCRFHQTSPDSHFTRQRVCSRATPEGRITLSEHALIVTSGGERTVRRIRGDAAYRAALREHFGIAIDAPWVSPSGPR
jgi:N-hydroxyarylamine O-acetyltransferase